MSARIRLSGVLAALCAAIAVVPAQASAPAQRTVPVTVRPAVGDLAVLAIRFPHAGGREIRAHSLRLSAIGAFGADYLAVALPRRAGAHGQPTLAVVADRPTREMEPARAHLRLGSPRALGAASVRVRSDPLSAPAAPAPAGFCALAHGTPLTAAELLPVTTHGAALEGLGAAEAVADAYDAACGLAYPQALVRAARGAEAPCPAGSPCVPAPEPAPQPPETPRCAPCEPRPGYACPLTRAAAAYCVADSRRSVHAG